VSAGKVPGLVDFFLKKFNAQYGRAVDIPSDTMRVFVDYHWPGNIRELENAVSVSSCSARSTGAHRDHRQHQSRTPRDHCRARPPWPRPWPAPTRRSAWKEIARQAAREAERVAIKEVLEPRALESREGARLLQISYKALLYKIVQCGLVVQETEPEKQKEVIAS